MNDLKLPNIFITAIGEEAIFNPSIIGWDGLALFKYLVRECWRSGKIALTDNEIETMFSIAEKRRAKLKKLFRDYGLVQISTGGQKHNITNYLVPFGLIAMNREALEIVYRVGKGGLSGDKLNEVAAEYAKMDQIQQSLLERFEQEIPVSELRAIIAKMNGSLSRYAEELRDNNDPAWRAEPFNLIADIKTNRLLRGVLRYHEPKNLVAAFDEYAQYMTYKKYGIEQEDWLNAKTVPSNIFNYFTAFNKKKPYDIIQRCLTQRNKTTFDKSK